jgi:hypothetical protein
MAKSGAERQKAYRAAHSAKTKAYWKRKNLRSYGIDSTVYAEMLQEQQGVCAICFQLETMTCRGTLKDLCVDHNHETGQIRGLLCHRCNIAIGMLDEDYGRILSAAQYLMNAKGYNMAQWPVTERTDVLPEDNPGYKKKTGQESFDDPMNPLNKPVELHKGKFPPNGWQTVVGDTYPTDGEEQ